MIEVTIEEIRRYGVDAPDEMIQQVIDDAVAQAELIAPGLSQVDESTARAVSAVIRGAVVRYIEIGQNSSERGGKASVSETAGPFSHQDSFRERTSIFLPSEERKLASAVSAAKRRVFAVNLAPKPAARRCGVCADECLGECGWYAVPS